MKKIILVTAMSLFLLSACGKEERDVSEVFKESETVMSSFEDTKASGVYESTKVYITGEVNKPGVYEAKDGARIVDVVKMAGGMTDKADKSAVNLSKKVSDEEMIIVPAIGETVGASAQDGANSRLVNLNSAQKDDLKKLPGIGDTKADAIIRYRQENGSFSDIKEITNVSGIGEGLYNNIKDLICV